MSMPAHPSFDDLSAFHDGEAPEWAAHVAGCAECRSQVERLVALTEIVAAQEADLAPAAGADPVARAMAAAGQGSTSAGGTAGPPVGPVTLEGRDRSPVTPPGDSGRSWRGWLAAASVAAVALVVTGTLAVLARGGDGGDTTTAFSDRADQPESVDRGVTGPAEDTTAALSRTVDGGDLGEVPDISALVARAGPGAQAGRERARAAPAPAAPSAGGQGIAPPTGAEVGTRPCEEQARNRGGDLGAVVFYGTATRAGTPAVVLGFGPPSGSGPVTLQMLAQSDCRLLLSGSVP